MAKINATRVDGETLWVSTVMTMTDGTVVPVEVPCFQPLTKQEVLDSVALRENSEKRKYDAEKTNLAIAAELTQDIKDKKV
jgi:hypothetical protein